MSAHEDEWELVVTRASDIKIKPDIVGPLPGWVVVDIIRAVLPDEYGLLPDGRSTAKVIRLALGRAQDDPSTWPKSKWIT